MERITLYIRTQKKSGQIRLRFRLTDGRAIQLYHKSGIIADIADLKKFTRDGSLKPRVSKYDERLFTAIQKEIDTMRKAYSQLQQIEINHLTSQIFEERIDAILNPTKNIFYVKPQMETLYERFVRFINAHEQFGTVSKSRIVTYKTVRDKLFRYLTIFDKTFYTPSDFKSDDILSFNDFIVDEYKYVKKYPKLYEHLDGRSTPSKQMNRNSATLKLRVISTFFNELENNDEIRKSPFRKLSRTCRRETMREQYDEPYALSPEELSVIMKSDVPQSLKEIKDVFLLHCAIGCRVGDFMKLDMSNISVTNDGIPYLHYVAEKTAKTTSGLREKSTPLVLFALNIIKKTNFRYEIFGHGSSLSKTIYNKKIRELLKHCEINRLIHKYDYTNNRIEYKPIYDIASSKLCRKTFIDISNKIQINMYVAGLHEEGSSAIAHYSKLQIHDLFRLLCFAFRQPEYKVDSDLNIINQHQEKA